MRAFAIRHNIDINSITGTAKGGRVTKEDVLSSMEQGSKVISTPAVRAFAKQNGVQISQVFGTGPNGRITKADVLAFISKPNEQPMAAARTDVPSGYVGIPSQPPLTGITDVDTVKKITGIKKAMTKTMTQSLTIPTFTFSDDIDATATMNLRKQLKKDFPDLTLLPFFIKALSFAMNEYPIVNSLVNPELDSDGYIKEYVMKKDHNFSVAIDSPHGLLTPNIKQVNLKSILQINNELRSLITRTNNNELTQNDYDDATFSVSSVGNIGGRYFVPTVLRPQAAIIAIGKSIKTPRYF